MIRLFLLLLGLVFSQESLTFNYQSQYGNGTNINDASNQEEVPYNYFENLLDINFNYNNLFFYTQLEYSNSPIYGYDRTKIKDLSNTYTLEYSDSKITLKYGHIQTLYGYGLMINMFQDQTSDFDNRIKGLEFMYSPYDMLDIFYIHGSGDYGIKSNLQLRSNDLIFGHHIDCYGTQLYTDFGDFIFSYSKKKTIFSSNSLNNFDINRPFMTSDTRLSLDLQSYVYSDFGFSEFMALDTDSEVKLNSFNFSYSNSIGFFDLYFEKSINNYNKILRENDKEDGYYDYFSLSGDILGINFLYEFKDYNMLYYFPISSSPPLGFMESNSVLISRNQHNIDFSDEIGHQLETRFSIYDIDFLFNFSMGMKHSGLLDGNNYYNASFLDLLDMDFLNQNLVQHKPFRDFYTEFSGWDKKDRLYYKLGYNSNYSYDNVSGKNYQTYTIPTQFVYRFSNNNSLTSYYEIQNIKNLDDYNQWENYFEKNKIINKYWSLSYHINKFGSITYYYDQESKDTFFRDPSTESIDLIEKKTNKWTGLELNLELSSSMQLSIFKGSQKGGLLCSNGICAVQPSFQDGIKVTFRALF